MTNCPILEMNISLIKIKYMPKRKILQLIRDPNKSKQYKKMSFSVFHVNRLTVLYFLRGLDFHLG